MSSNLRDKIQEAVGEEYSDVLEIFEDKDLSFLEESNKEKREWLKKFNNNFDNAMNNLFEQIGGSLICNGERFLLKKGGEHEKKD